MALLIFEGLDKSGKTTLKNKILEITNQHICWDRGPASQWVYGQLYKKKDTPSAEDLYKLENAMVQAFPVFYVYAFAETLTLMVRMYKYRESTFLMERIEETKKLYEEYFKNSPIPVIRVNTNEQLDNCIEKIFQEVTSSCAGKSLN